MNRKRLSTALAACTALTAIAMAVPAAAQSTEDLQKQIDALQQQMNELKAAKKKDSGSDIKVKWEPAPKISSADGRFEMNMRGRLLIDAGWVNDDADLSKVDATEFRAARLGIEGKAWNNVKYKFEADFAGNEVDITDAYIGYDLGVGEVMVGNFKTFNSLEELTSSRYITFMERGGITDAFGFERQLGVGGQFGGDNWSFGVGVAKGTANGGSNSNQGETFSARATFAPKIGDGQIHMGASYRYRKQGEDEALLRYRQRPHNHLATRFIDTKTFSKKDELFGLELAGVYGPFSMQGEYMILKATRDVAAVGFDNPKFDGWYVDASYFITGESRKYSADDGSFGRVKVKNPVHDGGFGAWQVAVRYDVVDLTDEGIFGGEQKTWIVGVNWHLNDYSRIMMNYSKSDVKEAFLLSTGSSALVGADGKNDIDAFGVRFQVDW